jgi:TatD DNase family protein
VLLLYPERDVARELKEAGVSRVSVSLNAQDKATYDLICRPKFENAFEKVLEFIKQVRDAGLDIEVTAVTVPEIKISAVEKLASELKVKFRVRQYLPFVW